jgi:hypothetical protein
MAGPSPRVDGCGAGRDDLVRIVVVARAHGLIVPSAGFVGVCPMFQAC